MNLYETGGRSLSSDTNRRIGLSSALLILVLGLAYIATGIIWWLTGGAFSFQPAEPFLTIMEGLMLLLSPAIIPLMAAVHAQAPLEKKTYALTALGFAIILVLLTTGIHFVQITIMRHPQPGIVPALISRNHWPSASLALDLLAWCFFLGLTLLFAAPAFPGAGPARTIRIATRVSGVLAVAGTAGPLTGNMWLTLIGTIGYDFGFLFVCALLVRYFAGHESRHA